MKKYFGISIFMILIFLNLSAFAKNLSNPNTDSIYFGDKSIEIKSNKIINALKATGKFEQFQNSLKAENNVILTDNFQLLNNKNNDKMAPDEFKNGNFTIDKIAHEDFARNIKMPILPAQINLPRPEQINMPSVGQNLPMSNSMGNMMPLNTLGLNIPI